MGGEERWRGLVRGGKEHVCCAEEFPFGAVHVGALKAGGRDAIACVLIISVAKRYLYSLFIFSPRVDGSFVGTL